MDRTCIFVSVLAFAAVLTVRAQPPDATASLTVSVPNTPAGRVFSAWLHACNSGDRSQLDAVYTEFDYPISDFSKTSCRPKAGFDLLAIVRSEKERIEYVIAGRDSRSRVIGELDVSATNPPRLGRNTLYLIDSNAPISAFQLRIDGAVRARVIRAVAEQLNQLYIYPEVGKKLARVITSEWSQGQYNALTDGFAFAQQLTDSLQAVSHDKHLRVDFSPAQLPKGETGQSSASVAREREKLTHENCGFVRVEWLPGNVGYVRFDEFGDDVELCTGTAASAMGFLANVDAIIFDLRENPGGDPSLVAFLETYLFDSRTHVDDLWDRRSGRMTEIWTLPDVPGKRMPSAAAYVLTSHATFSGAEAFAYELQALKRATVVGEVTGGGGHIVHGVRVEDRFRLMVPIARPINPVTKTNWEGTGVVPDVNAPAAQAFDLARELAAEELTRRRSDQQTGRP